MKRGYALKCLADNGEQGKNFELRSVYDQSSWTVGEWRSVEGDIAPCWNGLHCFRENGLAGWIAWEENLVVVQVRGDHEVQDKGHYNEKHVYRSMRIVKRLKLTKKFVKNFCRDNGLMKEYRSAWQWTKFDPTTNLVESVIDQLYTNDRLKVSNLFAKELLAEQAPEYL